MIHINEAIKRIDLPEKCQSRLINVHPQTTLLAASNGLLKIFSPGIHLVPKETNLIGYISLKKKSVLLGPIDENPFAPFNSSYETREEFHQRLGNRHQTQAFTAEGIEIVPNIGFTVELGTIKRRIRVDMPAIPQPELKNINANLDEIVTKDIIDSFRQSISLISINDIFSSDASSNKLVDLEQSLGSDSMKICLPAEYAIMQNAISIKVSNLCIRNIRLKTAVEEKLVEYWGKQFLDRIKQMNHVDSKRSDFLALQFSRNASLKLAGEIASKIEENINPNESPNELKHRLVSASVDSMERGIMNDDSEMTEKIASIRKTMENLP